MRILHILDHSIPLQSGYTFRTRNILMQQRKLGWETCHVTGLKHFGSELSEEYVDGLKFYRTSSDGGLFNRIAILGQLHVVNTLEKRIIEVAGIERPDVLHAHSPALNGLAALRAGKRLGLPVVYECRAFWEDAAVDHGTSSEWGPRYRLTRAVESYVFRRADAITTICEGLREEIVSRRIPKEKITVIPNAVDIDVFLENTALDEQLISDFDLEQSTVIGFIGSFYAYEGLRDLILAMPKILSSQPNAKLVLVGGGPDASELKLMVKQMGLKQSIIMTGRVPHAEVQKYYDLMDIMVYPRIKMRLTDLVTPLKPLEAMAQGKLVAASDVGGHRELIRDGHNGVLFKSGDPLALANCLVTLLGSNSKWGNLKQQGRAFVERERTWENSVSKYQGVYQKLMGHEILNQERGNATL